MQSLCEVGGSGTLILQADDLVGYSEGSAAIRPRVSLFGRILKFRPWVCQLHGGINEVALRHDSVA
jgi:hypothetical protein